MLIAVSGSQGAGKTTILNALKDRGFKTIERKTSRSILTEWNVTLQEVNDNPELTIKFQREIIERKHRDELIAFQTPDVYVTERTYMDLAVFNNFALAGNNTHSDFVNEYYNSCVKYAQNYDLVFYLKAGHFSIEHDGVRGSNPHYSRMVDLVMEDAHKSAILPSRLVVIDTPLLTQRLTMIETFIRTACRKPQ